MLSLLLRRERAMVVVLPLVPQLLLPCLAGACVVQAPASAPLPSG